MTVQQSPFLRQQRNFPSDNTQALTVELDRSYIDIATKMNARTIGTFAIGNQIVTGEGWFLSGSNQRQQTLRQLYIGSGAGSFPHGISFSTLTAFTRMYGTVNDSVTGFWYPMPYADSTATVNNISLYVTQTNIVISTGAGSAITLGTWYVVLEWLSQY